ncbi:KTSC domain-containing protein [Pedobacter sp. BS3]|uniref:KTSC domain-containing protein n=1 Tax=Pedobacter sp. BS3 TaxID=2567937 RepID=UPI0011EC62B9|nr:KTSC domain-containing protein [Pedobacter sp. BS3]TZF84577.1 KTSC domain-containing protein [Pedobacter sp. BS3]
MPSSVVAAVKYNPDLSELTVRYVSGAVYQYKNVPEKTYKELMAASSKGRYLNFSIKGKYAFEKIK